jgi:hypothetical protein
MGYLDAWKVVEEMIIDLRRNGILIPSDTMTELQSAKTLIHVLEACTDKADVTQEIDKCLFNMESYIMSKGQIVFGPEYVEKWLIRLDQAKEAPEETRRESMLLPNIPRGSKWIRINPSTLSIDESKKFADELHLSCIVQNEGYLLVHGEDAQLRELVKKMAAKYEKSKGHEQVARAR